MRRVKEFLIQPYPFYANTNQAWRLVGFISFFIGAFCVIFKPFGMEVLSGVVGNSLAAGFGLVTFLASVFNMVLLPKLIPQVLSEAHWKVYKELLWVFWMIFFIATLNYVYSLLFFDFPHSWMSFLNVQWFTFLVAVLPGIGVVFYKQIHLYKKNLDEVAHLNHILGKSNLKDWTDHVVLTSSSKGEQIKLDHRDISYIEAAGNYVEVFYQDNGSEQKALLRNKISEIEGQLTQYPILQRCHRTYIVNIKKVSYLEGNSQGYKLHLLTTTKIVPVARSYSGNIKKMIEAVFDDISSPPAQTE